MTDEEFRAMLARAGVAHRVPRAPRRYLSRTELAERIGVTVNTLQSYARKGLLPPPDAVTGATEGWSPETADAWQRARPGRGRRTGPNA